MSRAVERFYADEPLFAVLSSPRYRSANQTLRDVEEFFDTGEEYVSDLVGFIRPHLDLHFTLRSVLEFGCGPGRLAIPFARRAARVVAVDESEAMLDAGRRFAARFGTPNIEFRGASTLAQSVERFDLVNCHLVLQRVPVAEGLQILRTLLSRVDEIGVFHLPYRDNSSLASKITRWVRLRSRVANAVANLLLRKPLGTPLISATVYGLDDVLRVFEEHGFQSFQVRTVAHDRLETATFFVRRGKRVLPEVAVAVSGDEESSSGGAYIDVRKLVATVPIEEWNRRAEAYFATLPDWGHHLAKPFGKADETPLLLINLAVLLQGLQIARGQVVLDFGAGTGWLSRYLTQLGCRAILLDVSSSALRIAEETYRRIPVIGERPAPTYLHFDGRRIDLPDESVDRIVSFDAFHHAANPDEIIRELGRILKPGGIAAFAEPGPAHSRTAQSQFEMRTYGVLENDIDLPQIWRTAQGAGFGDLRVAAFNIPPFHVALEAFNDLLDGGRSATQWADRTREFLGGVRNFFLTKGGAAQPDSARAEGLRAAITFDILPSSSDGRLAFRATVTNIGSAAWLPSGDAAGGVSLGCHLYDADGQLLNFEFGRFAISTEGVVPQETVEVTGDFPQLPADGEFRLELDCVAEGVTWFSQVGSLPATKQVER
jgi:SAM-dependent methyltransferase